MYLSRDSRGRVFSPGLVESPGGPDTELYQYLTSHLTQITLEWENKSSVILRHYGSKGPHSPESKNKEPDGFLLRQEGAS